MLFSKFFFRLDSIVAYFNMDRVETIVQSRSDVIDGTISKSTL